MHCKYSSMKNAMFNKLFIHLLIPKVHCAEKVMNMECKHWIRDDTKSPLHFNVKIQKHCLSPIPLAVY